MNCNACGKIIEDGSLFCAFCGNRIDAVNVQSPTVNEKSCPRCQEKCHTQEFFCPKCGYMFSLSSASDKTANSTVQKSSEKANLFRFLAVGIHIFQLCGLIATIALIFFKQAQYNGSPVILIFEVISILTIIAGLIIGNNNFIPGIGYAIYGIICVLQIVILSGINILFYIFSGVAYMLLAALFFIKKGFVKKLWFLPAVFGLIAAISSVIYALQSTLDDVTVGVSYLGTLIVCLIPVSAMLFAGFSASRLWVPEDTSADEVTQSYLNDIY